jgi:hypothetical protein
LAIATLARQCATWRRAISNGQTDVPLSWPVHWARKVAVGAVLLMLSLGTVSASSPGVKAQLGATITPNSGQLRVIQLSRPYLNAIGERFARRVKEMANPYNALQPFTTNALCDAEL